MIVRKLAVLLLPIFSILAVPACAGDVEDDADEDHEDEPVAEATDALTGSPVDCKTTRMTAYDNGKAYQVDVIKIGSKRTTKSTGHAFLKMQKAARAAGVTLSLSSGFRTNDEQQYFYNCYKSKKCNKGNLAARPGYSNHQNGRALDLSTSSWLANNAGKFGFRRTVKSEPWHYEFSGADPGGPCAGNNVAATTTPEADNDADDATTPAPSNPSNPSNPGNPGAGASCSSDGQCNPGNDGAGLICEAGKCVDGCRSNAQCPGVTTCKSGKCQ